MKRRRPQDGPGPRVRLLLAALGAVVGVLLTGATGAFGYWLATSTGNPSLATADTLPTGSTPTAATTPNPNSTTVSITFAAASTSPGNVAIPAGQYTLRRHPAAGAPVSVTATCAGITTITCTESAVPDGTWQYTDTPTYGLNWVGTQSPRSAPVVVDTTAPTVPVPTVPAGYVTAPSVPVGLGSVTDAVSGVNAASVTLLRASAPLSAGTCVPPFSSFAPVTLTGGNDTTVVPGRCYQYQQRATDNVGNTATSGTSTTVKVDTTAPSSPALAFSGLTGAYWPGTGTTVYFRGGTSGGFAITPASSDAESGIAGYAYPELGTGWSRSAGSYSFTGAAGTATGSVTATNGAGSTAATTLTARSDVDGPTGGALTVNGVPATAGGSTSYIPAGSTLTLTGRTDFSEALSTTQSGLVSSTLTLRSASLTNNTCATFGPATPIIGTPSQTVTTGTCHLLTLTGTDNVGNTSSIASTVLVDTSAPSAPTLTFSDLTNVHVSGARVFFRSGATSGSLTLTATSIDDQSGIATYSFPNLGSGWSVSGSGASRTYTWSAANPPTTGGGLTVSAANGAGLVSPGSTAFTMVPDAVAPTGGALTVNGVPATAGGSSSYATTTTVVLTGRTDFAEAQSATQSGLASSTLTRQTATLADNTCGTFGTPTTITGAATQAVLSGSCYLFTFAGTDNVGNAATLTTTVKVDTTAPSTPTWGFGSFTNVHVSTSLARIYYRRSAPSGSLTITASSTDAESGIGSYTFPSLGTGWSTTGTGAARTYSWTAPNPTTTTSARTLRATNGAGLQSPTSSSYRMVADITEPTGGALTVNGVAATTTGSSSYLRTAGATLALSGRTDFTESQSTTRSGLAASTLTIQSAPLVDDTCGAFGAPSPVTGTTTQTVTSGTCYLLTLTGTDNVGNAASLSSTVKVDATPPTIAGVALGNGGTAGRIDRGDTLTVTFSEPIDASDLCSLWTSDTTSYAINASNAVTIRVVDGAGATTDRLAVQAASGCGTFDFGSLDLGSNAYVTSNVDFAGFGANASSITWDPSTRTLGLTLGNGGPVLLTPASTSTYTLSTATDPAGNAVSNSPFAAVTGAL